jgi:hypothetical protein
MSTPGPSRRTPASASPASAWLASAGAVTLFYSALTLFYTWPVAADPRRNVPGDLGDPLLNLWIVGWNLHTLWGWIGGQPLSLTAWADANIFHPERLTLAYSELLVGPSLLAAPVHALTGDLVLAYNGLFLSSFVLSGLGAYLLVREVTASPPAALVAGAVYAFLPYRIEHAPHLQVLASQWMPFVLFGVTRFARGRSPWALWGAAGAWLLQNLSCGYYMIYFAPFVPAWACLELWRNRRLGDLRAWAWLIGAGALVLACSLAVARPYFLLRDLMPAARPTQEVETYSANLLTWLTAPAASVLWGGWLRPWPQAEGQLFPGAVALILVTASVWPRRRPRGSQDPSADRRVSALRWFVFASAALAVLLSLGPTPAAGSHRSWELGALFRAMYAVVPGFDGLRAAARFGMIAGLFIAVLAGLGWARLSGRLLSRSWAALGATAIVVAEAAAIPFPVNRPMSSTPPLVGPPAAVFPSSSPPAVYRRLAALCDAVVVTELPLGDPAWDLLAVYGSTAHWKRLVNGYSGYQPRAYRFRAAHLTNPLADRAAAWGALTGSGTTHVVLNERAYDAASAQRLGEWLSSNGARVVLDSGHTTLFALPGAGAACP